MADQLLGGVYVEIEAKMDAAVAGLAASEKWLNVNTRAAKDLDLAYQRGEVSLRAYTDGLRSLQTQSAAAATAMTGLGTQSRMSSMMMMMQFGAMVEDVLVTGGFRAAINNVNQMAAMMAMMGRISLSTLLPLQ